MLTWPVDEGNLDYGVYLNVITYTCGALPYTLKLIPQFLDILWNRYSFKVKDKSYI